MPKGEWTHGKHISGDLVELPGDGLEFGYEVITGHDELHSTYSKGPHSLSCIQLFEGGGLRPAEPLNETFSAEEWQEAEETYENARDILSNWVK